MPTRLARLLLNLSDRFGTVGPDGIRLRLGLTHEDLSSLIDYGPGQILLKNLSALVV